VSRPAEDGAALLAVAEEAARAAGSLLAERFAAGFEAAGAVSTKSTPTDPVSEADVAAEAAIRDVLRARMPDDAILGEEGDDVAGSTGRRWIVDPLDGTVNFLYGNPQWCVSVACEGIAGVVLDPVRDELFAAVAGGEVTCNGAAVTASACDELPSALVATGFGYDAGVRAAQARVAAELLPRVRDLRRAGSAALDLAWAAAGRVDAYFEFGVKPWDTAAGEVLCRAAGLEVVALDGGGGLPPGMAAAPTALMDDLLGVVAPAGA
jgi:myo-inositol-1(or 4)-monophosphatase